MRIFFCKILPVLLFGLAPALMHAKSFETEATCALYGYQVFRKVGEIGTYNWKLTGFLRCSAHYANGKSISVSYKWIDPEDYFTKSIIQRCKSWFNRNDCNFKHMVSTEIVNSCESNVNFLGLDEWTDLDLQKNSYRISGCRSISYTEGHGSYD